jgi:ketosteroid isomerase-like protein
MSRSSAASILAAVALVAHGSIGGAQVRDSEVGDATAVTAARRALDNFITQWNTADDANLRRAMHFPFVTVPGGGALVIDTEPVDFSAGFDQMRASQGWSRSSFDFDSYTAVTSSPDKVHAEIGFSRFGVDGAAYMQSRVFYIVTKQDGRWGVKLRTSAASPADLGSDERAEIVSAASQTVRDFFTAFNAGDAAGTVRTLNHPHLFMTAAGGFSVVETADDGPRPNFEQMRQSENWQMSTIDTMEASIVTRDKVHIELTFTRWHPDGTRYWTVPALWIVTRAGDHWGIQVRSLMPATFDTRGN